MRTIKQSSQFKRDLKREAKGPHRQALQSDFVAIVSVLANDQPLAEKHRDRALTGDWKDHRDCQVKPNLVLLLRPYEVLSGVANAAILKVAHNSLGVLLQHHHMLVGRFA